MPSIHHHTNRVYRPRNGAEAEKFAERFCARCARRLRVSAGGTAPGCAILARPSATTSKAYTTRPSSGSTGKAGPRAGCIHHYGGNHGKRSFVGY